MLECWEIGFQVSGVGKISEDKKQKSEAGQLSIIWLLRSVLSSPINPLLHYSIITALVYKSFRRIVKDYAIPAVFVTNKQSKRA